MSLVEDTYIAVFNFEAVISLSGMSFISVWLLCLVLFVPQKSS
jgi:hypothetical protein